jgi:RHS repeat-associated protein
VIFARFGYDKLPDETIGVTPSSNNRGQLAWQTSFTFGTKVTTTNSRDRRGRVISTTVNIADHNIGNVAPTSVSAATAGLLTPMDFTYANTYDKADRQVTLTTPSIPGITGTYLGGETVVTGYDDVGRTTTLRRATVTGNTIDYGPSYAGQPSFDDDGRLITRPLGSGSYTYRAERSYGWDQFGRLSRMIANTVTGTSTDPTLAQVQDDTLAYDAYGNVTSLVSDVPGSSLDERQCFKYNTRQQLVRAYSIAVADGTTPTTCADTTPASAQAPYDQSFDYDSANRMSKGPAGHTYSYTDTDHPHAVTSTTSGSTSVGNRTLTYDDDGNVTSITRTGHATQAMWWDPLGRMTSTTVGSTTIRNIYDVDRQRVISTTDNPGTADDTVTVTLPGLDFTIGRNTTGDRSMVSANDYKTIGGANVAIRTKQGAPESSPFVQWVLGNYHGSVTITINANTGDIARNWYTPYGNERDSTGTTTSDRAFLNQEKDTTGLSYLTNRYYDPRIGVFLSVDPLVDRTAEPYLYAGGNPATLSDLLGLEPGCGPTEYSSTSCEDAHKAVDSPPYSPLSGAPGKTEPTDLDDKLPDKYRDMYPGTAQFDEDVRFSGVPLMQISLCLKVANAVTCNKARVIGNWVAGDALSSTDTSQYNAYQHILLAATLTAYLGEHNARPILDAHENISVNGANGPWPADRLMDIINNEVGIEIGNQLIREDAISMEIQDRLLIVPENYWASGVHLRIAAFEAVKYGRGVFLKDPEFPLPKREQSG